MDISYITFKLVAGDMLIFMPGQEDIEVTCDLITGKFDTVNMA